MKIPNDLIISRQPATWRSSLRPGEDVPLTGVELVLVDPATLTSPAGPVDISEWYRCETPDCEEAYTTAASARSHLVKHSRKRAAARAESELAQLKKTKADSFSRRSNGVRSGREARAERHATLRRLTPKQILNEAADELIAVATKLRDVAQIFEVPRSDVSPEELASLREKAAAFEVLSSTLKSALK